MRGEGRRRTRTNCGVFCTTLIVFAIRCRKAQFRSSVKCCRRKRSTMQSGGAVELHCALLLFSKRDALKMMVETAFKSILQIGCWEEVLLAMVVCRLELHSYLQYSLFLLLLLLFSQSSSEELWLQGLDWNFYSLLFLCFHISWTLNCGLTSTIFCCFSSTSAGLWIVASGFRV